MVLIPMIASQVDVPVIAAGGIIDGRSMAAAIALGAQGVQMGTRMVSSAESPVHDNWKNAIIDANDQSTVLLNQFSSPALRALRTEKTTALEQELKINPMQEFGRVTDLYFGGNMNASIALTGQVAGRIESVKSVSDIIDETMQEYWEVVRNLNSKNHTSIKKGLQKQPFLFVR